MKIIHVADMHLGAGNTKLSSSQKKICKEEQNMLCDRLFMFAKQNSVDVILICGDLFHSKNVSNRNINLFFNKVKDFGKPVIYVRGNHDEDLNFVDDSIPSNFLFLNEPTTLNFQDIDITGQSNLNNLGLLTLNPAKFNILMLHGDVYSSGSEYINLKELKNLPIDYLALGHLHNFEIKPFARGNYAYSGAFCGNGFDECGQKGFIFLDIDGQNANLQFIPLDSRQYHIVQVDITGLLKFDDIKDAISKKLENIQSKDFVRVVLSGYYEENAEKFLSSIQDCFKDNFFYFELKDESKLKIDLQKYKGETLSFKAELLKLISEDNSLSENEKNLISQISVEALRGDDLSL